MLTCCNQYFYGTYAKIVADNSFYYRRIEYGICPHCGCVIFIDYIQRFDGEEIIKQYQGERAVCKIKKWQQSLINNFIGTKGNQNVYYGDFKRTNRKDENGNPIYYQLRKNFNNQSEIIGEIKTVVYTE